MLYLKKICQRQHQQQKNSVSLSQNSNDLNQINKNNYNQKDNNKDKPLKNKINFKKFKQEYYLSFPSQSFSTKAIHKAQQKGQKIHGSINVPIHFSSTSAFPNIQKQLECQFQSNNKFKQQQQILYHFENPTINAFQKCFASLQNTALGLAFSSGNNCTSSVIHLLKSNDHILICNIVYGGTQSYLKKFSQGNFKLQVQFIDMSNLQILKKSLKKNTRLIWMESPTNPTLKVIDLKNIINIVNEFNMDIITAVDNTFATPYLQSPLDLGADLSISSVTKYIGGHSDILMGAIAINQRTKPEIYNKLKLIRDSIGGLPSPLDTFLALRGVKTLQVRMKDAIKNAYHIAWFLKDHQFIQKVYYPGLSYQQLSSSQQQNLFKKQQYQIAKKQMRGFGAMISFVIKNPSRQKLSKFLKSLKIIRLQQSLGGVQSSMKLPAIMNDQIFLKQMKQKNKLQDSLIRFSVGIQSLKDLIEDLDFALRKINQQQNSQ